jgi:hypothetical protein
VRRTALPPAGPLHADALSARLKAGAGAGWDVVRNSEARLRAAWVEGAPLAGLDIAVARQIPALTRRADRLAGGTQSQLARAIRRQRQPWNPGQQPLSDLIRQMGLIAAALEERTRLVAQVSSLEGRLETLLGRFMPTIPLSVASWKERTGLERSTIRSRSSTEALDRVGRALEAAEMGFLVWESLVQRATELLGAATDEGGPSVEERYELLIRVARIDRIPLLGEAVARLRSGAAAQLGHKAPTPTDPLLLTLAGQYGSHPRARPLTRDEVLTYGAASRSAARNSVSTPGAA